MSAKQNQVLQIDPPQEIIFKGPFTDVVTSTLKLTNPTDRQLCFKVKTTAPKQYCVRPNSGLIPPQGVVNVAVMLQPFDCNAEEKSKHKFMVQAAFVADGETSLDTIWKNTPAEEFMDSKLKVLFDMPESDRADKAPLKQTPLKSGDGSNDSELRRLQMSNKALQGKVHELEQNNEQLKHRLSQAESGNQQRQKGGHDPSSVVSSLPGNISMVHVIIAAIISLILGLLFGKAI